ncbi:MAG: potassium channel family protein, partial [Anaerolineaceae bacterium]
MKAYDLFILAVTLLALIVLLIFWLPGIDAETKVVAFALDTILSIIFLADFTYCLRRAPDRWHYFKRRGWMDLIGSVPVLPVLRFLRLARAAQIVHSLRQQDRPGVRRILRTDIARTTFWITLYLTILLLAAASLLIIQVESASAEANIVSGQDALWWSVVTIATVGYGDRVPVTDSGRILGSALMVIGVLFVSVLTSYVTTALFILRAQRQTKPD